MQSRSIQRRLIVAVVLSQVLLAIGLVWMAVYLNHRLLRRAFDNALQGRVASIAALVRYSEEPHPRLFFETDMVPPSLQKGHPDLYLVLGSDGRLIARSSNWPDELPAALRRHGQYEEFVYHNVRYRGLRLDNVGVVDREPDISSVDVLTVSYASPTDEMQREIWLAGIYTAAGSALLLLVSVALAVWGLRRGLRPLADLAAGAATISASNWELNPSQDALHTTELLPLTQAMTTMLDGLHRAFTQQREFVANAAHELKTPVAILKSTLQSLLQQPRAAEEYRIGLEQALDDMDRLEQLLHMMLRLARAEQWSTNGGARSVEVVDVGATCRSALDLLHPLSPEKKVQVEFSSDGPMPIRADGDDLRLVWSNLLENAIRFSPDGGRVQLRAVRDGERGRVEVEDHGPGIFPEDLPRIFERFYRGDSSRARNTGGYGLGLAISKALIEAYGGSITAESSLGHGTRMVVLLPLQSGDAH
jgi:signal transduction histidine kinase